jgi:hypothetical protein
MVVHINAHVHCCHDVIGAQVKFNAAMWLIDDGAFCSPPTHVTDVAKAVLSVLHNRQAPGNTFYLAGPETLR